VIVVSNVSPIISLSAIAQFQRLQRLYDQVTIPEAVHREVVLAGSGRPGATDVQLAPWITVRQVADTSLVARLLAEVNPGEAEAIVLAVELGADLLLVDERRARAVAARFGLAVTGVLGVLLVAKQRGVIPAIKPLLDALIATAGYRVSERLYARALEAAGED
jgi:predicted nucleic acid-binding protein